LLIPGWLGKTRRSAAGVALGQRGVQGDQQIEVGPFRRFGSTIDAGIAPDPWLPFAKCIAGS
jgi:hypothetical protein